MKKITVMIMILTALMLALSVSIVKAEAVPSGNESTIGNKDATSASVVFSGTYSGVQAIQQYIYLPKGTYHLTIESIESSDTDADVSLVNFLDDSGKSILMVKTRRDIPTDRDIELSSDVASVVMYASDNYPRSSGDEFIFYSINIYKRDDPQKTIIEPLLNRFVDPEDLLPEKASETVYGITYNLIEKGHYIVSGTATADNTWLNILKSLDALPDGFESGKTYYLRYFCDDPHLIVKVFTYDADLKETKIATTTKSTEITLPNDAVGLNVRVVNEYADWTYLNIHFEIALFDSENYHINEIKAYQWAPRPMLTIIDDDGKDAFRRDIMPIVIEKHTTISSSVPALYPEFRERTEAYLEAKEKFISGKITEEEFNAVKQPYEAIRVRLGRENDAEDFGMTFMGWKEVMECYSNGCEILCHTYSHNLQLQKLSEEQIQHEYQMAKNLFEMHGIPAHVLVYAGNTGAYPQIRSACSRVFDYGIYAAGDVINYAGGDPYNIKRFGVANDGKIITWDWDTIQPQLDALAASRTGWMVWTIHTSSMYWGPDKADIIRNVIDYAQKLNLPIVTAEYGTQSYFGNPRQ
ncbi:MAG: polysaccharide deacetylase family protein [Clostridia bacterium]|nr:polysaccharide deacetylase family protein [Clostridia bacterium]